MGTPRFGWVALAIVFAGTACRGIDPRHFERLHYGMPHASVAPLLESDEAVPVMRFFAPDGAGVEQDVRIELYECEEPHPNYAVMSVDGRLASVTLACLPVRYPSVGGAEASRCARAAPPWRVREGWWHEPEIWDWDTRRMLRPWSTSELSMLARAAVASRLDLAWDRREPIDAAHPLTGRYTAIGMGVMLVFPLAVAAAYLPFYAYDRLIDDSETNAIAARSFLLAAPRDITLAEVVARLGPPTEDGVVDSDGGPQRVLAYTLPGRYRITIGWRGERMQWVDFGDWYTWVPKFVE